jgi:glycosyltransferase involved in cell wall biosynthesis
MPPNPRKLSDLLPITVVIITLNEKQRVGDCLASVEELTDDVVVVDAGSQDGTKEQCRERGARVYERDWRGFSEQKNFGNSMAKYDWILSLDADERVTPELVLSIRREWARGRGSADAYKIRFANYFGGKRIRFGAWNPEWHVRLFDRRKTSWNTDEVHESLRDLKKIRCGQLVGKIQHLTVSGRKELEAKTVRYSGLFQQKLRRLGRTPPWTKVWLNPAWRFIRDFFLRLGGFRRRGGLVDCLGISALHAFKIQRGPAGGSTAARSVGLAAFGHAYRVSLSRRVEHAKALERASGGAIDGPKCFDGHSRQRKPR